jgi:hypothetical protein
VIVMKTALVPLLFMAAAQAAGATPSGDATVGRSCPQALAVYSSENGQVSVEFSGAGDLGFSVLIEGHGRPFEGHVYPGEDEGVTEGVVLDDCPDGDATGDEIAACTVWQGRMRTVGTDGSEGDFPLTNGPAAAGLAFPGLGGSITERMPGLIADRSLEDVETLSLSACLE